MKKTILAGFLTVCVFFSIAERVNAQNVSPIDLILVLDTSTGMSSSYDNVANYLTGDFLREFLRVGDTFHLITFAGSPRFDSARRVNGAGDIETIVGRILIQYPVESGSNAASAIAYAEQYITTLPDRSKKIVLITQGAPATSSLVTSTGQRLSSRNSTIDYVQVTPGQRLTNLPSSGRSSVRTAAPAATTTAASQPQASTPSASTSTAPASSSPAAAPSTSTPSATTQAASSASTTAPSTTQPSASSQAAATPSSTQAATPASPSSPASTRPSSSTPSSSSQAASSTSSAAPSTTQPSASTQAASTPSSTQAATPASPSSSSTQSSASQSSASTQPSASSQAASSASAAAPSTTQPSASSQTAATSSSTQAASPSSPSSSQAASSDSTTGAAASGTNQKTSSQTATSAAAGSSKTGAAFTSSLPFIIGIIILILLVLGLILFLLSRKLSSSPNRVITTSDSRSKDEPSVDHSKELASYAAGQTRQRVTPYDNRHTKTYNDKPVVINPDGPLLLNLFVSEQNTSIGRRNIHSLKSGYSLTVGGGKTDDYFIFLVPVPAKLGEIRRNGSQLTFTPHKPKYFPDIGSNEVRDCINKTIRIISDKNYEIRFRFEMYEDPLVALNRLLHSVKVPG